jgi:hypothetical protein
VAGRVRSIEKWGNFIGNRTRDLPACTIVYTATSVVNGNEGLNPKEDYICRKKYLLNSRPLRE